MTAAATESFPPLVPVHLHVHTEYSLLDGSIRIKDLLKKIKEQGGDTVAITDHGNLFGAIEFYTKAKEAGIKAIIGSEIFHPGSSQTLAALQRQKVQSAPAGTDPASLTCKAMHLVLLCKNLDGYKGLTRLVSNGYLQGLGEVPVVAEAALDTHNHGLIAMSSCVRGEFGQLVAALRALQGEGQALRFSASDEIEQAIIEALDEHVRTMQRRYPESYYIELIDNHLPAQKALLPDLVTAARHYGLPLTCSSDAHYLTRDKADAHAVLLGIKHGLTTTALRGRRKTARFHLFDAEEMRKTYAAWPEALANTRKIADLCQLEFKFGKYYLPKFELSSGESSEDGLRRIAKEMLEERLGKLAVLYGSSFDLAKQESYRERLTYELDVICKMGFAAYFLIVQDFINWAKRQGIPVGPGRGSGAGSLVAYALRITDLDPIPYNLLFERFLNPDRVSMPDFDVDFCQDRRGEVIQYVTHKYGADQVAQITNFGRMKAKAIVRDVGRVLELGYGRVDRIARLIPSKPLDLTLAKAMEAEPRIEAEAKKDERVSDLLRYALELEGLARQTGVHAAGIVISDGPMTDYVPVFKSEDAGLITQFEMKMAEKVGLVKFDFLGLKTLTVIEKAVQLIKARGTKDFDISLIPMDDKKVYQLISAGHSVGIFQLESSGMKKLIMDLKPSCFEDIIAVVALFRPGPLGSGMVEDFIERKHGRQAIEYPLPQLTSILKDTYGIILYQEQVMKIAGELASYSLGEADLLRRAMGKKNKEEMEKQKSRFVSGAIANGIDEEKASGIFDLMEKFAEYGFNKSHSAAYGLVTYQTAYLKTHYPEEFMAASMTCDLGNTTKIIRYVDECRRMGIKVLPPNINTSILEFAIPKRRTIEFGLAAIKGIGPGAVQPLVKNREQEGPYHSLDALARRVDLHHSVGKKTLELLVASGALDDFGIARHKLFTVLSDLVRFSENEHAARRSGQLSLFDFAEDDKQDDKPKFEVSVTQHERKVGATDPSWLKKEKALLGVYLSRHPLDFYREEMRLFNRARLGEGLAREAGKDKVQVVALLAMLNDRLTKEGKRMLSVRLEDQTQATEAIMYAEDIPKELPEADTLVVVNGEVSQRRSDASLRFVLKRITPLEEMRLEHVEHVNLRLIPEGSVLEARPSDKRAILQLHDLIKAHPGDTELSLEFAFAKSEFRLKPATHYVELSDAFLTGLAHLQFSNYELKYRLLSAAPAEETHGNDLGGLGVPPADDDVPLPPEPH